MKMRRIYLLPLLLVSGALLPAAMRRDRNITATPWEATIADLNEYGRRTHVRAIQYRHFARAAVEEHRPDAARLFRALAHAETIHENNCAQAIRRLGGSYSPPVRIVLLRSATRDNVRHSLDNAPGIRLDGGDRIVRALEAGNRYTARMLIWCAGSELRQQELLERCDRLWEHPDTTTYLVCPTCGNVWRRGANDSYCPFCLTSERRFLHFD